ncbi:aminotransferase class I/II-fold pyridoxal phosphate-dependent enzyme [Candidatus Poribacteria bacterium]|nr:aminotransferase class I/II-fold pyridoxal phosphate-dependent enzyme [Candidatus Poribacteria bacterium]
MEVNKKNSNNPKVKKFSLSNHYNASQLRMDTWTRLKAAVGRLDEKHKIHADMSPLPQSVSAFLEMLEPIESYWVFPGKEVLAYLEELFERQEYQLLSNTVTYVVRMLVSDSYRNRVASLPLAELNRIGTSSQFSRVDEKKVSPSERHYLEVLFVDNLSPSDERELRKRMLEIGTPDDKFVYDIVVVPSFEDALIAIMLNYDIQSCVIRSSFPFKSKNSLEILQPYTSGIEDADFETDVDTDLGPALGQAIKNLRPELDLFLVIDSGVEDIATRVHQNFRRVFYRQEEHLELHLSIRRGILERYDTPFFSALKEYSQRPTGVFHAMPISRGNSIFKSHWIQDMGHFYGRNIFLAETSATTGGLDSLLQPTGPLKKAQEMAGKVFGAQHTFFVTNGTSTANKIVTQALLQPGDIVLVDRDYHKSHHYGLVLSGAYPVYLDSYPIAAYSMYGAVPLREIKRQLLELKRAGRLDEVKMLLLTNCTFDGLVYNVERVMEEVLAIKPDMIFLWDEAWFGFAAFTPTYRQRTAMHTAARLFDRYRSHEYRQRYLAFKKDFEKQNLDDDKVWLDNHLLPAPDLAKIRVYATQSTHKKLTSLRQGSMIHIYDEEFNRKVEDTFHEAYMTHTSTSPNYQILASLDIGRRQVEFEGFELVQKSIEMAMLLRAKIADHPLLQRYFRVLRIHDLIPKAYRPSGIEHYYDPKYRWTRMEEAWQTDEFVLDPTHITLYTGEAGIDGNTFKNQYLMDEFGIQVNKTSRNTVLFMTNIGTTRSAVAFLIGVLLKIAQQLEAEGLAFNPIEQEIHDQRVKSLTLDLPPLPDFSYFHPKFRPNPDTPEGDIRAAYFMAYNEDLCEFLKLDGTIQKALKTGRQAVSTAFIIPYPPGFPILVPGQVISQEILDFLKALDVKEIHGYRPELGLRVFTQAALSEFANAPKGQSANLPMHQGIAETEGAKSAEETGATLVPGDGDSKMRDVKRDV